MKHLLKGAIFLCVVTLLLSALSPATAEAKANSSLWKAFQSPFSTNAGAPTFRNLASVAAVSASDIWAVGNFSRSNSSSQTLIEHWNGKQWSVVSSPNPGSISNALAGISAVSASDLWAVGSSSSVDLLVGIAVVSSSDIWTVGQSLAQMGQSLIEHWNSSTWSVAKSPNQPGSANNFLLGIAVISANNIWAVGGFQSSNLAGHTLTEHWNGSTWSIVPSP